MIITRSPLRVTLGGGGTDLPSYYRKHGGFVVSAAIDSYVYVTVMRPFKPGVFLKYSSMEQVKEIRDVRHPIIREALLSATEESPPQVEITALADIPAGTGLGSSGSFTTALLKALYAYQHRTIRPDELAELACYIEIDRLGEPIGKQDQYIAAYGGLTCFEFRPDDTVAVTPLKIGRQALYELEDSLLLFFTGFSRSASTVLNDQKTRMEQAEQEMINNLHHVKELGLRSRRALEDGKANLFGEIMHEHWVHKRKRSMGMSNPQIDEWYELGLKNGALGGKLVGAGGGGFLMFYAENHSRLRQVMAKAGLEEVRFRFDFDGTKVLFG